MRMLHARIRNFRCVEDVMIDFERLTAFIGPNNAGKSTILRALHWFFNGEPLALKDADMYCGADGFDADSIDVEVTFGDLTDEDRKAFGEVFAPPGAETVTVRRTWSDKFEGMSVKVAVVPEFARVLALATVKEKREAYDALRGEFALPAAGTDAAIKAAFSSWQSEHPERLQDQYLGTSKPLFGFNAGNRFSGLFDYVFVSADQRASEEATEGRKTLLDQLVKRCVDFAEAEAESELYAFEAAVKRKEIYERHSGGRIEEIQRAATDEIARFLPGYALRLDFRSEPRRESRPELAVLLDEANGSTPIELQGHGAQRAALIGLLRFFAAEIARTGLGGSVVLAIEEPELSQHRSQERAFARSFQEIATDPTSNVQIMYVTHSPSFIDPQQFQQLRRVVSEPGPKGGRRIVEVRDADPLTTDAGGRLSESTARRILGRMNPGELSEACFERAAIIVEGVTEKAILRGITTRPGRRSLDEQGITVVVAGGKEGIPAAHAVLASLGIPTLVVFDTDGARLENGVLTAPKEAARKATSKLLERMAIDEADFKIGAIAPGLYAIEGDLEQALDRDWPKWQSARDTVVSEGRGSMNQKDFVTCELAARECPAEPTGQLAEIVELAGRLCQDHD